ncbi:MAG: threonylcarbamoyl-AMP synthase [Bacteroidales bacterium]|nr:threonylcarbamoyl-AMP synthase [Bacteroidales bacterium]MBQ8855927.1 threonylcarbamoyl-AMP synthase [Bacteroidales bacterium]
MKEEIQKALEVLRAGGIILYPTDTVWGIGCDASDPEAVAKVYAIKNREDSKSLVLLASDMDMICRYVKEVPEMAVQLVEVNDKPMTIIYPDAIAGEKGCMKVDRRCLAFNTVAEDGTVGIRIPMMDFCQQLISRFGRPIVSTSANISGEATPKKFSEISEQIRSAVDHIVDPALERGATGQSSSIIKVGLDYSIEIIRK